MRLLRAGGLASLATLLLALPVPADGAHGPVQQASGAEVDAVREVLDGLTASISAGDADATRAAYADDVFYMAPRSEPVVGNANMSTSSSPSDFRMDIEEAMVHGEWGHAYGTFSVGGANPGKVMFILSRQSDGAWKISHELWNADAAPQDPQ